VISGGNKEKIEKGYLRLEGNFSYCRFRISLAASFASFFHFFLTFLLRLFARSGRKVCLFPGEHNCVCVCVQVGVSRSSMAFYDNLLPRHLASSSFCLLPLPLSMTLELLLLPSCTGLKTHLQISVDKQAHRY